MSESLIVNPVDLIPYGQVVTRQWLLQQGVNRHTLDNAIKSKKLKSITNGVIGQFGPPLDWQGLAASLNRMNYPVYIGGLAALGLQGVGHYVQINPTLTLYSPHTAPTWLGKVEIKEKTTWNRTTRLWDWQQLELAGSLRKNEIYQGYWLIASLEQAVFEALETVPEKISFEHMDNLMQGLVNLSPKRLDLILRSCQSIKVKRLFFFFSDRHSHAWRKKLEPETYDLGKGKRQIAKGGRLDKKYQITVPAEFYDGNHPQNHNN